MLFILLNTYITVYYISFISIYPLYLHYIHSIYLCNSLLNKIIKKIYINYISSWILDIIFKNTEIRGSLGITKLSNKKTNSLNTVNPNYYRNGLQCLALRASHKNSSQITRFQNTAFGHENCLTNLYLVK